MERENVHLSVDLVTSALSHLRFLEHVASLEHVFTHEVLRHSLKRYEQLWLPLCFQNRKLKLEPPVDVAWFWYLHMLQPLAYRRDCRKMFKDMLDHRFNGPAKVISCLNNAIEIWYATYPKEGFNIIRNEEYVRPVRNKGQVNMDKSSKLSSDLLAFSESHMYFCYQVALPHFRDRLYLQSALQRYKQFLQLKKLEPDEFLTPSVDILLMWYTHMCHPVAYAKDMTNICGKVLDNNVKVTVGPVDERFVTARQKTNEMWKKVSKEELMKPGSSLRFNERRREIFPMTADNVKSSCVMQYNLHLSRAEVFNVPRTMRHFSLKLDCIHENGEEQELVLLAGSKRNWILSTYFIYNNVCHKEFRVTLNVRSKLLCLKGVNEVAKGSVNIQDVVDKMGLMDRMIDVEMELEGEVTQKMKFVLEGTVAESVAVLCDLTLKRQPFQKQLLQTADVWKLMGLSGVPRSAQTDMYTCHTATHLFSSHRRENVFQCNVVHIPEMVYSQVEVRFHSKLVATSRLIGSSTLPNHGQVGKDSQATSFDPELGERAMLLRNHCGDCGICVARWHPKTPGCQEHLEIRFTRLSGGDGKVLRTEIQKADIEFGSFNANMYTGRVLINPINNTVGESLALFWSICMLYVLCTPAGVNRQLSAKTSDEQNETGLLDGVMPKSVQVQEKNCQMLLAAGLEVETPSNNYLRSRFGSLTCDVDLDAQDITVQEQKTNKKLLKKDSNISLNEFEKSHRKRKMQSSSNLSGTASFVEEGKGNQINEQEKVVRNKADDGTSAVRADNSVQNVLGQTVATTATATAGKRKKVKKRKSSKLEDMLEMSDDSITRDDVEEVKLVRNEKGKKVGIVKKISSDLNEELKPPEDSLDEAEEELKEFYSGLEVVNEVQLSKEQTTLIKDVVEKKKQDIIERERTGLTEVENDKVTFQL